MIQVGDLHDKNVLQYQFLLLYSNKQRHYEYVSGCWKSTSISAILFRHLLIIRLPGVLLLNSLLKYFTEVIDGTYGSYSEEKEPA